MLKKNSLLKIKSQIYYNLSLGLRMIKFLQHYKSTKIFCIGFNKTGTTSISSLFSNLGYDVAPQHVFEPLLKEVMKGDFKRLIKYVKYKGVVFQDVPFSVPNIYKILDREFPNSKFILTVRDNSDIWYSSIVNFHSKKIGNGNIPTVSDLATFNYIYEGWILDAMRFVFNTSESDIYNAEQLKRVYENHNRDVIKYFSNDEKLLVVNLKDPNVLKSIQAFLGIEKTELEIPWKKKTEDYFLH